MSFFRDRWGDFRWLELVWAPLLVIAIALVIVVVTWAAVRSGKEWQAFSAAHHCRVVGHMTGDSYVWTGFGSNGQAVVHVGQTPDKTGWLCDDGVTYWR